MKRSSGSSSQLRALRLLLITALVGLPVVGTALPAQAAATVEILDGGNGYLNAAEIAAGVRARGTAEPNWDILVTFDDADSATPPVTDIPETNASGNWQTRLLNLSSLKDGTITVTAKEVALVHVSVNPLPDVTPDIAVDLNPGTDAGAKDTTIKDVTIPNVVLTAEGAEDGALNAADIAAGVVVHGKTEPGATGTLVVNKLGSPTPSVTRAFTADAAGDFATDALNLSSIADGTVRFSASADDLAGNHGTGLLDVTKITLAPATPTVIFVDPLDDGQLTQAEIHDVTVIVKTIAGGKVHLVVDDADPATIAHVLDGVAVVVALEHIFKAEHLELSNLQDGPITATATVTDAAGNVSAPGTDTITKAAGAPPLPPGVEILDNPASHPADDPGGLTDGFIDEYSNLEETADGTALRVRVDPVSDNPLEVVTASVTVDDDDPLTPAVTSAPRAIAPASGVDTRTFSLNVTGLKDGGITAVATIRKDLGAPAYSLSTFSDVSVLDLHTPSTVIGTVPGVLPMLGGGSVNGASKDDPPTSAIQLVAVTFTDDAGWHMTRTATLDELGSTDTTWEISGVELNPGTYTVYAQAQDEAGNFEPRRPGPGGNSIVIDVL